MLINTVKNRVYQSADKLGISRDVINYGAKTQFLFIGECFLSVVIATLIEKTFLSIAFILAFTYLRAVCGGYHCKGYLSCICLYVFMVISSTIICSYMNKLLSLLLVLVTIISLFVISPVQNENNRLNSNDKIKYKRIARIRICTIACLFTLLYLSSLMSYAYMVSLVLTWLSLLCFVQLVLERRKNEHYI